MNTKSFLAALLLSSAALITIDPPLAAAQEEVAEEPLKVLVGKLSGAKPTSARKWVVEGLEADPRFTVIGEDDSLSLKTGAGEAKIAETAAKFEADAVILGTSTLGKKWIATLTIHDGKDGSVIETVKVKENSFGAYEKALIAGEAAFPVIMKTVGFPPAPPVAPEPDVVEEEEEPVEEEPEEEEASESKPSALDLTAGIRLYSRAFRYTDTLHQLGVPDAEPLIDYNLDAAPMPIGRLRWYPGAHFGGGWTSHIGLNLGFEQGIATKVRYVDDLGVEQSFSQSHRLIVGGLRGRIPVSIFNFAVLANYSNHSFSLKDQGDGSPSDLFPNVSYSNVELGGDGEVRIGSIVLGAHASYVLVLSPGDIKSDEWFPNAKASGVDFGGHVGFGLNKSFDILTGVDFRGYGFNFNEIADDAPEDRIAGGATDRYMSVWFGLRYTMPGSEGSDGSTSDEGDSGDDDLDFD